MLKMLNMSQLVLLLCVLGIQAQDFMFPNVNIITELGKLKNMEDKLQIMEVVLQHQQNLVTLLNSTVAQLEMKNKALMEMLRSSQAKIELLQKDNEGRKIAFSASLLASGAGHTGPLNTETSLIYKNVFSNFGNGYNSDTGIFTAPVSGVYYFRFFAHCHAYTRIAVSLYKNGVVQCSVYSERPVTNHNASNGIVLKLEKGDTIYTKLWEKSWVYDDSQRYTSFGGFLIFPL